MKSLVGRVLSTIFTTFAVLYVALSFWLASGTPKDPDDRVDGVCTNPECRGHRSEIVGPPHLDPWEAQLGAVSNR